MKGWGPALLAGVAAIAAIGAWFILSPAEQAQAEWGPFTPPRAIGGPIAITQPDQFSPAAETGAEIFAENCAACHGPSGVGSDQGPPLVHVIYEPGHHADGSFYLAVQNGVRAHHWRFGDMPPVESVGEAQVTAIITYIRELQRANGIE